MTKDFNEYYREYLKKYNENIPSSENNENIRKKNISIFFMFIPFLFVFIFSFIIDFDTNYDSKEINLLYSEKYINKNPYTDKNQLDFTGQIITYKQTFSQSSLTDENETKEIAKQFKNPENYSLDVFSDNRIKNQKLNNNENVYITDWKKAYSSKKIKFIETLLPLVNFQNQQILIKRERLFKIKDYLKANNSLKNHDIFYLNKLASKYKIKSKNKHKIDLVNELLQSVDIIPNSIALAQAANESAWGTSRFAREYNALFGQYTYDEKNGVIPYNRDEGKKHLIQYFSSIDKSVESYFHNINSHYAYSEFRKIRSEMSRKNFDIKLLTKTLDVYAEDKSYVDTINLIIDSNKFTQFDSIDSIFTSS
tara:strand:+ start:1231 stop:2328 length:1098 start_codon:yes stop_codon:yes gene_type:complete